MQSGTYEYQSEFARKYVAQGRQEGRQEGHQEGLQEGLQKGRYEGERAAVLEVLDARGFQVDAATRQRIEACTELEQLKAWLRKAVTVRSVQELFSVRRAGKNSRSTKASRSRPKR